MIFDTDVLIWTLRGNLRAARVIEAEDVRAISIVSGMELFQGARDKKEMAILRDFIQEFDVLPLTENVGFRASIYMEEYALKAGLTLANALIAAVAVETRETLCTGNDRHFHAVSELQLKPFRPR